LSDKKNYNNNDYEHNFKIYKGIKKEEGYPIDEDEDEEEKQLQLVLKQSEEEENLRKERERIKKEEEEFQLALKESEKDYYYNNNNNNNNNNVKEEINNDHDNNKEIKGGGFDDNNKEINDKEKKEEEFDENYGKCPITYEYMENPVLSPSGIYYEKSAIINWIKKHNIDPMTRERLTVDMLIEDEDYRKKIIEYRKKFNK